MRAITILGTRPEIIRLSLVVPRLDIAIDEHIFVNTLQNAQNYLNGDFFTELHLRKPDVEFGISGETSAIRISEIITKAEELFIKTRPNFVIVLGDTDSALSAFVAKRLGIQVFHLEAGNRCRDKNSPEEVNRRVIDHSSDILMPYTERSRQNLLQEGIRENHIYVVGNPINEVIKHNKPHIDASSILLDLYLEPEKYILATIHRAENVDYEDRVKHILRGLEYIHKYTTLPIIISTHPRTKTKLPKQRPEGLMFYDPFGFHDFAKLEQNASLVITDSGTVQEECSIFGVPNITIRDTTERPETVESGSNIVCGVHHDDMLCATKIALRNSSWTPPKEYLVDNVSQIITNVIISNTRTPLCQQ